MCAVHQDIVAPDNEYGLAGWSLLDIHEICGVRHCSTLEMSSVQREAKLTEANLHPCLLVRGQFQSAVDSPTDEESAFLDTRWVGFEEVMSTAICYDSKAPEFVDEGD